jgi:hypothetical protein
VIGYDFTGLGKRPGKAGLTQSGTSPGRTQEKLLYGSGSGLGEVPGSDSGKESGTISGKNPGKCLGKKSGKELPGRVRRPGRTKTCKIRGLFCFG